jgi:hypothetical protein
VSRRGAAAEDVVPTTPSSVIPTPDLFPGDARPRGRAALLRWTRRAGRSVGEWTGGAWHGTYEIRSSPRMLIDREMARVYWELGLRPAARHDRLRRRRSVRSRTVTEHQATPPAATPPPARGPALVADAYFNPEDLVPDSWLARVPVRMADAEDGEQPWDAAPYPFIGPPPCSADEDPALKEGVLPVAA